MEGTTLHTKQLAALASCSPADPLGCDIVVNNISIEAALSRRATELQEDAWGWQPEAEWTEEIVLYYFYYHTLLT